MRYLEGLSNNDSMLEKYLGALQRLEVMLLDPGCPTRETMGLYCRGLLRRELKGAGQMAA